jgi:hypothetical protein
MDFQTNGRRIYHPSGLPSFFSWRLPSTLPSRLRASRVNRASREGNRRGRASHGSAARSRGGELACDCLAVEVGRWRTCACLCATSHSPIWVGRSGVVAARLQGVAVVGAQAEAHATIREVTHTPTPGVVRMNVKAKDLQIGMLEVVENKGMICTKIAQGCALRS